MPGDHVLADSQPGLRAQLHTRLPAMGPGLIPTELTHLVSLQPLFLPALSSLYHQIDLLIAQISPRFKTLQ